MESVVEAKIKEIAPEGASWDAESSTLTLTSKTLVSTLEALKDDPETDFVYLRNLTAYERLDESGVIIVYHLTSLTNNHTITVLVDLDDGELSLPSVYALFKAADWQEREVFDMFGVHFIGHPDLRRILLDDTIEFHPLRKSFTIDPAMNIRNVKEIEDSVRKAALAEASSEEKSGGEK